MIVSYSLSKHMFNQQNVPWQCVKMMGSGVNAITV